LVYRRYFNNPNWKYIGVDIVSGPNVDMVLDNPYNYPYIDSIFDLVICTSVLEHVEEPIRLIRELLRITKEYIILVVPWDRPIHNYPIDYWRMSPEALINFVTENNKFEMLEYGMLGRDSYIIAKRI
jgi:SAM-dependent methyltransferase